MLAVSGPVLRSDWPGRRCTHSTTCELRFVCVAAFVWCLTQILSVRFVCEADNVCINGRMHTCDNMGTRISEMARICIRMYSADVGIWLYVRVCICTCALNPKTVSILNVIELYSKNLKKIRLQYYCGDKLGCIMLFLKRVAVSSQRTYN